jgi:hypothetical protein
MKRWKQLIMTLAVVVGVGIVAYPVAPVGAINVLKDQCTADPTSTICDAANKDTATSMIKTVINTMLFILGIIAIIMIVVGGIRYTTSTGDASRVKAAKDTIMYAVVGLVVALLAFTIVNYVITAFK